MHTVLGTDYATATLQLAGVQISVSGNVTELLHGFDLAPVATGADGCAFSLSISSEPDLEAGAKDKAVFRGRDHIVIAAFEDEIFTFDLVRRKVHASVSRETCADLAFWRTILFPIAFGILGPTFGLVPLHSACLGGDRSILLVGNSGSGKSTLTVAMAKRGWKLISDDWTYCKVSDHRLVAHGLNAPVKLLPDAASHFPELNTLRTQISFNGEEAFEVDAADTLGVSTASKAEPEAVVFIERTADKTSLEPLPRNVVLNFFSRSLERLPSKFVQVDEVRRSLVDVLSTIPAYHYQYSGSPDRGARDLDRLLGETSK